MGIERRIVSGVSGGRRCLPVEVLDVGVVVELEGDLLRQEAGVACKQVVEELVLEALLSKGGGFGQG